MKYFLFTLFIANVILSALAFNWPACAGWAVASIYEWENRK